MHLSKNAYIAAGALIALVAVVTYFRSQGPQTAAVPQNQEQASQPNPPEAGQAATAPADADYWEGTLQASNNPAKGNLMLKTEKNVIYINTSRDYSQLLGKEVRVSYEGTLESFRLGDIAPK